MKAFSASPLEIPASLWRNREVIGALIARDVLGRYRGSFLGILWSFLNPLALLAVYTFVFGVAFKARWSPGSTASPGEFATVLFAGLIAFNFFAECINRSPSAIQGNANFVKKLSFPLEVLPCVAVGSALCHAGISLIVWLAFYLFNFGGLHATALLAPFAFVPLVLLTIGGSWFLSALGVYLRDLGHFVGLVVTAMMFLSPIFYPATALPESLRWVLVVNPVTPSVEQIRDVLVWGRVPDMFSYLGSLAFGLLVAVLGFAWFQKTRRGFADVL
jgi:lipopolysaccharide transport system permease protein